MRSEIRAHVRAGYEISDFIIISGQAMSEQYSKHRNSLQAAIIFCFFLPVIVIGGFCISFLPLWKSWMLVILLMAWSSSGTAFMLYLMRQWTARIFDREKVLITMKMQGGVSESSPHSALSEEDCNVIDQLTQEIEEKSKQLSEMNNAYSDAMQKCKEHEYEISSVRSEVEEQLANQASLLTEYQQTITEQRTVIERKQSSINSLEDKIRDLNYEVRTLLQIGDAHCGQDGAHPVMDVFRTNSQGYGEVYNALPMSSDNEIHTPYDAAMLLQKCIKTAENFLGAGHLASQNGRSLRLTSDSYAIDLRRLFDSYRSEYSSVVLMYSPEENRLLFVNNQIRGLLGWNPERFVKDAFKIVQKGGSEWRQAVIDLQRCNVDEAKKGKQVRLLMKTRVGEDLLVRCYLGRITVGIFSNTIIGVMYPA